MNMEMNNFLKLLGDSRDVTGGGSAAALVASLSASLVKKVFDNERRQDRHPDKREETKKEWLTWMK